MPLLAGLGPIGLPELLIIAFIIILVFGVGRLPEVGGAVGRGIREFRKATKDEDDAQKPDDVRIDGSHAESAAGDGAAGATAADPATARFCGECGARNPAGAKFCSECGTSIKQPVS